MIVMKFGGTSVGDAAAIKRFIGIVKSRMEKHPVIVVSAITKATDTLQKAAETAAGGELPLAKKRINELKTRHASIAQELIKTERRLNETKEKIDIYFSEINDMLKGIFLLSELSPRSIAKIVTYGELLSSMIIAEVMKENGIKSNLLDARDFIYTDDNYLKGDPDIEIIKEKIPKAFNGLIEKGYVPITQGFISSNSGGITTTLGRGGSDYSAALIGMALDASEIEIWTDVDGMLTADPCKVNNTKLVSVISFEEAAELAYFGAKVLHPATIQPAVEKNIPVRILNSMNPENEGTLIVPDSKLNKGGIKSISCKENITVLNIFSTKMLNSYGFLKKIFEIFDKNQTSVDLITTSEVNVSLTLDNEEHIPDIVEELSHFSTVKVEEDRSLVCVVGKDLKNTKGIAMRVFKVLGDFNITMISQGASVINLSFVVNKADLSNVMQNLHDEFFGKN